eukprot:258813_1
MSLSALNRIDHVLEYITFDIKETKTKEEILEEIICRKNQQFLLQGSLLRSVKVKPLPGFKTQLTQVQLGHKLDEYSNPYMRGSRLYENCGMWRMAEDSNEDGYPFYHEIVFNEMLEHSRKEMVWMLWVSPSYDGYITNSGLQLRDSMINEASKLTFGYIREIQLNMDKTVIPRHIKQLVFFYNPPEYSKSLLPPKNNK